MDWIKRSPSPKNNLKKIIIFFVFFNLKSFILLAQDTSIIYYLDENLTNEIESVIANGKNSYVGSVEYIKIEFKGENKIIEIAYARQGDPVYELVNLTNRFLNVSNGKIPILFETDFRFSKINGIDFRNSNRAGGGYIIIANSENEIISSGGQN